MPRLRHFVAAFTLIVTLSTLATRAQAADSGAIDASITSTSLASPTNAYGPWFVEDLSVRLPPGGQWGIEIASRQAADRFNPNTERMIAVDNYHRWSNAFNTYAAAMLGSAAPYARNRFTVEGDASVGKGVVAVAGYALGNQYVFGRMQQLTLGTDYYFRDDYLSVRYRPIWSAQLGNTQGYSATLGLGHPGRSMHVLRIGGGGENDASLINPFNPTVIGERTFDVGYSYKHWTSKGTGYHIDTGYGTLNRRGGGRIYSHLDLGVGLFFAIH